MRQLIAQLRLLLLLLNTIYFISKLFLILVINILIYLIMKAWENCNTYAVIGRGVAFDTMVRWWFNFVDCANIVINKVGVLRYGYMLYYTWRYNIPDGIIQLKNGFKYIIYVSILLSYKYLYLLQHVFLIQAVSFCICLLLTAVSLKACRGDRQFEQRFNYSHLRREGRPPLTPQPSSTID